MTNHIKYKTKQRDTLIQYLETKKGVHITANDVCEFLKKDGIAIGQATVYRQLERLVDEGVISKYIIDANSPACFEYIGLESHGCAETCFHCKCEKCGKLIHLHCEEINEIGEHLLKEHKFKLNSMRTVFYGVCDECSKGSN